MAWGVAGTLAPIQVLFLCTGNICRSPMAEALLRHRLAAIDPDADVRSAGLLEAGRPASAPGVDVFRERGIDLSGHRSTTMVPHLLEAADLVIAMARVHVREAVALVPDVWPRTFTLKELVRRATTVGPRVEGQSLDEWLRHVHAGRTHRDLLGDSPDDDVADPMGYPRATYARTATELEALVDRLVSLAWAPQLTTEGHR